MKNYLVDENGYYGEFGGAFVPKILHRCVDELRQSYPTVAKYGLKAVMLITPETSEERIRGIDANTDGFIYMVSSAATTGAQKSFDGRKLEYFKRIDSLGLRNPRMTGFGISDRDTFRTACEWSSGAIVGSRFVTLLDEHEGNAEEAVLALKHDLGLS